MHVGHGLARLPAAHADRRRARRQWSRQLLELLGVGLHSAPILVKPGTLVVANHVSWLDVMVINTILDCSFVAKSEIAAWPLLGTLLKAHDTLYVRRRPGRHLRDLNVRIAERLHEGDVVVVFPEGTTTDGSRLLPFRSALFQAAVDGRHAVQPFALEYLKNGERCAAAAFVDDQTLLQSLASVATLDGLTVRVEVGARIEAGGHDRKSLAALAREEVYHGLCGGTSRTFRMSEAGVRSALEPSFSSRDTCAVDLPLTRDRRRWQSA